MIDDGLLVLSQEQVIDLFKYALYLPACLLCWLALARRLPRFPQRMAAVLLLVQIPLLLFALDSAENYHFWGVLWHYDVEHNIPSALSSTMLATAGVIALVVAWVGRGWRGYQRLYFLGIGLLLLAMGADEYYELFKRIVGEYRLNLWERGYLILGLGAAAATTLMALVSRGRSRLWQFAALAGLALAGAGGLLLDSASLFCGVEGVFRQAGCDKPYAFEEIMEHLGGWLILVAMLGAFACACPQPSPRLRRGVAAIPILWLLLIPLHAQVARLELGRVAQPTNVRFAGDIALRGYEFDSVGDAINISMYFSAPQVEYTQLRYFLLDLVDIVSGESNFRYVADLDLLHSVLPFGAGYSPVYRQRHEVWHRDFVPPKRAHWIVLGAMDINALRRLDASNLRQLNNKQVILGEFVVPATVSAPPATALATFDEGFTFVGIELPAQAQPGDSLEVPVTWHSAAESRHDYSQFLHFVHEASGSQWGYDQPPLGNRLPMRLWYEGLLDTETWLVTVPDDVAPGEYAVYSGLYNLRDMQRLRAKDAAGMSFADARVPLGSLRIAAAAED
ncbi:MAG: hypothetical protein OXE46_07955 [Chloroflexi bacterium]|nr:hypothetical protein [Chloroflexota bacterium]